MLFLRTTTLRENAQLVLEALDGDEDVELGQLLEGLSHLSMLQHLQVETDYILW